MKNLCVLFFIIFITSPINAQIFEGQVGQYESYDMTKIESYKRMDINGHPIYNRRGFISFQPNKLIFMVSKSVDHDEIYIELPFEDINNKMLTLLSVDFGIIPMFLTKITDKANQVTVQYISFNSFNRDEGLFVVNYLNQMYLLPMKTDVLSDVMTIYNY